MTAMDNIDIRRLAKLLGMIGSAHDGEALNAARAANKLVRDCGLTWSDVIVSRALPILQNDELTAWERDFLSSLRRQTYPPTPKQREVFDRIRMKAERWAGAAAA
jgi:hypothetical protein